MLIFHLINSFNILLNKLSKSDGKTGTNGFSKCIHIQLFESKLSFVFEFD